MFGGGSERYEIKRSIACCLRIMPAQCRLLPLTQYIRRVRQCHTFIDVEDDGKYVEQQEVPCVEVGEDLEREGGE